VGIEQEEPEELVVAVADAGAYPGTVVIHSKHTAATD
jgi:hypothetical protein